MKARAPRRGGGASWKCCRYATGSQAFRTRWERHTDGVALARGPRQCRGHVEKIPPARRARHLCPPVARRRAGRNLVGGSARDRGGARDFASRSEEHTSELQSLMRISYAVFCLKKKNNTKSQKRRCN